MPKMMNEAMARATLSRMHLREVAIAAHYAGFSADMHAFASADHDYEEQLIARRQDELCSSYGLSPMTEQRKPFAFSNGVAIIPVHGTLINRFSYSWGFVTGYNFIRTQTALAGQDPDVTHIVYDHNSYGGEAAGCFEAAASLKELANGKPTLAVIDSNCYSASFAMACGADRIVCTPSGGVGSVGVVSMHIDMSKMLEEWGLKIQFIFAGEHKVDGNPFEPLPKEVKADIQKSVDTSYAAFTGHVAKGRGMTDKAVRDTEARIYRADDAKALGFIDAIATPSEAVRAFLGEPSGSTSQPEKEDESMSTTTTTQTPDAAAQAAAQASAQAATEARTAERARISGIQNCEEAKGREQLASHLALNTDMSLDQAKGILGASAKTEAPAADPKPAAQVNGFQAAMDASQHPNVGADAGSGGGELTAAQKIVRDHAAVYGAPQK